VSKIRDIRQILGVEAADYWGPAAQSALDLLIHSVQGPITVESGEVDERSEQNIKTLHRKVQPLARELIVVAQNRGIHIKVTSGTRTFEEQDRLFAQGHVTKARGGYSNHNYGLAFDVTIFNGKDPVWESPQYKILGQLGKSLGLSWGGDWTSIVDEPHFELRPEWASNLNETNMIAELRRRHTVGQDYFT
jgi:peptidoglycan L-alanyl-D-glutamate endopeptidase CwlK